MTAKALSAIEQIELQETIKVKEELIAELRNALRLAIDELIPWLEDQDCLDQKYVRLINGE